MRNIELKARLRDRAEALRVCAALGASAAGEIRQADTYFRVAEGRLKLREAEPGRVELIFYRRADQAGPKGCDYHVVPAPTEMKALLSDALGVLAVVRKVRTLYLWENVRIHLDEVDGLGAFIEFEAVLAPPFDDADGHRKLDRLIDAFGLRPEDHLACSYLDLLLSAGPGMAAAGA